MILGLYLIALFVIFYILNLVWFMGILKHLKRQLMGGSSNSRQGSGQQSESGSNPTSDMQEGLTDSNKGGYSSTKESNEGGPRKRENTGGSGGPNVNTELI
jgi:hypothetical protein